MKTPKSRLEEECAWRKAKNLGAQLNWEAVQNPQDGRFRVSCTFIKEAGVLPLIGSGEGQKKKDAEHAAALDILKQMGIDCDYPNHIQSPVQSPKRVDPPNLLPPVLLPTKPDGKGLNLIGPMDLGMKKTAKSMLEEEYAIRKSKDSGARLDWVPPVEIGAGRFHVICRFIKETGVSPIIGSGEGKGVESAENAAARDCLEKMEITGDYESRTKSPRVAEQEIMEHSRLSTPSQLSENSQEFESNEVRIKESVGVRQPSDAQLASLVNAAEAKNYVGMLQEYCAKNCISLPKYHEGERRMDDEKLPIFKIFCTVGKEQTEGEAKQLRLSKKIAAYKMCCHLAILIDQPVKISEPADDPVIEQLEEALKNVKINSSPPRKVAQSKFVSPRSPFIPPSTDGKTFQISQKLWMYPEKKLGGGGYGDVFKGYKEDSSFQVAIKRVRKAEAKSMKNRELDILKHAKHPNLVLYYFMEEKDEFIYYVMELADFSLDGWLKKGHHEYETRVKICEDIALGLKALHNKGVVHRDIKPNNVLIFMKEVTGKIVPHAKLTVYGISRVLDDLENGAETSSGHIGTPYYMPPEAKSNMKLLPSFDIFSLGLVLCITMTEGKHLFNEPENKDLCHIESNIKKYRPCWDHVNGKRFFALKNLLQVMVDKEPERRSDMGVILEHPFFWSVDKCFTFVRNTSADIKNNGACNSAISKAAQDNLRDLPDWKSRLDERIRGWMEKKDRNLDEMKKKGSPLKDGWRKYRGNSILQLINFIRDQKEHYSNWSSSELECEEIFGRNGCNYNSYFMRTFPELPTLLYAVFQNPEFRGNETEMYYKHNVGEWFKLKR